MPVYSIGAKAYYDSMRSGLIPCVVTEIRARSQGFDKSTILEISARTTAAAHAYPKGSIIVSSPHFMVPRAHVRRRRYSSVIIGGYTWQGQTAANEG